MTTTTTTPTTKQLYEVTITVPMYVYAESHDKANEAGRNLAAVATGLQAATVSSKEIEGYSDVPEEVLHDRPYGSEKRTIGEILYYVSKSKTVIPAK